MDIPRHAGTDMHLAARYGTIAHSLHTTPPALGRVIERGACLRERSETAGTNSSDQGFERPSPKKATLRAEKV